jgi:glycosyltransferase involved in cell wall biosynthesis
MLAARLHTNVHVLPVMVPMMLQPPPQPEAAHSTGTVPRVLFVGRLVAEKNLTTWLQVAAQVAARAPSVHFDVVGDGPLREDLEALTHHLGLAERVQFHGFVPYEDLPAIYQAAAVLLLTSHYEGFGRVVVESYLQGVPVVSSRTAGTEDIIADGVTGFLHRADDVSGIAASVLRLLHDAARRQQMGEAGGALVRERFAAERLARDWMALLISAAPARCC